MSKKEHYIKTYKEELWLEPAKERKNYFEFNKPVYVPTAEQAKKNYQNMRRAQIRRARRLTNERRQKGLNVSTGQPLKNQSWKYFIGPPKPPGMPKELHYINSEFGQKYGVSMAELGREFGVSKEIISRRYKRGQCPREYYLNKSK